MRTRIDHAQIITMMGDVLTDSSILFDEKEILMIGNVTEKAERVIDATGKTVLPGFIDCHVHPGALEMVDKTECAYHSYNSIMKLAKSGISTVRTVGTKYNSDVVLRNMIEAGKVVGPRIKASGEVLCITCGHGCEIGIEVDTVGETLKAARGLCKQRVDWLKMMPTSGVLGIGPSTEVQLSKEQIDAIISVGKAFNTPTCAHLMNYDALKLCVEAGLTCVEHGYDMDEEIAKLMVERGTWYIPTAVVTLMEMTHIKPTNKLEEELVEKAKQAQERVRKALKIAIAEGVKLAVGTDSGCPFTGPDTDSYATELYIYSISGMSNEEILKCATIHGAELLGIEDVAGTLEVGKEADIVVIDGNPLNNIKDAKKVEYTFSRGKLLYHRI